MTAIKNINVIHIMGIAVHCTVELKTPVAKFLFCVQLYLVNTIFIYLYVNW